MRSTALRVVVAAVVVLVIVLALWLRTSGSKPAAIGPAPAIEPTVAGQRELAPVPAPRATAAAAAEVAKAEEPKISLVEDGARAQGQFEFDVVFAPVDELGRALAGVRVEFALEGHRANCMGLSDGAGELHRSWRGDLATIRGTVFATSESGTSRTNDVVLAADAPQRVRFRAESFAKITNAYSWKVVAEAPAGRAGVRVRDMLFFAPPFETDAAGNGLFTDPDLIALSDPNFQPYETQLPKYQFPLRKEVRSPGRPGHARIEVLVHDRKGAPISAPYHSFGARLGGWADRDGRFTYLTQDLGPIELEVGGGVFAAQRKQFDPGEDGSVQTWDVELSEMPTVRGRLVGADGTALARWHVQAREDQPPFGFLQGCDADGSGNFRLGLSGRDSVRLLVNAPEENERPAVVLADHQAATEKSVEFLLNDSKTIKAVTWQVEVPATAMGRMPEARVVQRDSLEGIVLTPCAGSRTARGAWALSFQLERAIEGPYAITCSIPGGRSQFEAQVLAGAPDLGAQSLSGIVRIGVPDHAVDPRDKLTIRALETAQGVRVRSEVLPFPGSYFAPVGDVELWITGTTSEGRRVKLRRDISGKDGERVELALDELHPPTEARAPGSTER